ncbi:MAG: glycosyltransferase family 2 protein [Verrucomicrobiota bacterium]
MRFSIITPSFRGGRWLKLNIPSVADQGVELEHILQDACSDDGTQDWLPKDARVIACIEKDKGMYDAVNRGLRKSKGELLAYLNCDEQYLPGALRAVGDYFDQNPEVDVCFADTIVVDPQGNYICHRGSVTPTRWHTYVGGNLAILTCATFFRRRLLTGRNLYFSDEWRDLGDVEWVLRLLDSGARMGVLRRFTSVFADTGDNMNLKPNAQREGRLMLDRAPRAAHWFRPLVLAHYRLRKLAAGLYGQKPFAYEIYTERSPEQRVRFEVTHPTGRWLRYTPPAAQPSS